MALGAYFSFFYKNYFRSHRYLREIVLLVIFNVFFWGFLYGPKAEDAIWTVFGVLALLLTMVTTPSVFFLEKDNSLYFALMHPNGRLKFLFSKFLLIFTRALSPPFAERGICGADFCASPVSRNHFWRGNHAV
ncbi:MAG: hypothetical protein P8184_13820 [Calditrichia bacterium]